MRVCNWRSASSCSSRCCRGLRRSGSVCDSSLLFLFNTCCLLEVSWTLLNTFTIEDSNALPSSLLDEVLHYEDHFLHVVKEIMWDIKCYIRFIVVTLEFKFNLASASLQSLSNLVWLEAVSSTRQGIGDVVLKS